MQDDPGDQSVGQGGPERQHPVADGDSNHVQGRQPSRTSQSQPSVAGGPRANVQSAQAAASQLISIEESIDAQFKTPEWPTSRAAWIRQCESCRTIRDVVEALIDLDNHLPHLAAVRAPQQARDTWRARIRTLHTYPTLTNAINHYRNDMLRAVAMSSTTTTHNHAAPHSVQHEDAPTPPLWNTHPPHTHPPHTHPSHTQPPPAHPLHTQPPTRPIPTAPHRPSRSGSAKGRRSVEGNREEPTAGQHHAGQHHAGQHHAGQHHAGQQQQQGVQQQQGGPMHGAGDGQGPSWELLTAAAGFGQVLAALDARVQAVEHRVTHMEARCSLLDTLVHEHVTTLEQQGMQTHLQLQVQVFELTNALHTLAARLDTWEQRTVRTTEESQGRLDALLTGLVHALQRQDASDTAHLQLTNIHHALTNLSHKVEAVEASVMTTTPQGHEARAMEGGGGDEGDAQDAQTPKTGVSPTRIALPSVAEEVMQEWARRSMDSGGDGGGMASARETM